MKKMIKKAVEIGITFIILLTVLPTDAKDSGHTLEEAFEYAETELLSLSGVSGVSWLEDPPGIIIYVVAEEDVRYMPGEVMGFETEIRVGGEYVALGLQTDDAPLSEETVDLFYPQALDTTDTFRPLVGGISCSVPRWRFGENTYGTLGIIKNRKMLSCAHVFALDKNCNRLPVLTSVLQPGTEHGGFFLFWIGWLLDSSRISFDGSTNYADCAIARLTFLLDAADETVLLEDYGNGAWTGFVVHLENICYPQVGDTVRKSGAATKVTTNEVIDTHATITVGYGYGNSAVFKDQILVAEEFSEPGDSGSIVEKDSRFVGMVFAGSSYHTVVCKASRIKDEVNI